MIIVLLGAPGSGKGTQAKVLSERYGLTHLSTGDVFRSEIAAKTTLGLKAADYVKSGRLVPDDFVTEMVAGKMDLDTGKYLLDGFPRNLEQAEALDKNLANSKVSIDLVILLNLTHEQALKRVTSRRICLGCSAVYNTLTKPSKVSGICDLCGGKTEQREDDIEETASKRLMVFEDLTQPLVAYYRAEQIFHEVDGSRGASEVTTALCAIVDRALAGVSKA